MVTQNILFGLGGLVIGGVTGFFIGKHHYAEKYQKRYEEDVAEMEEFYKSEEQEEYSDKNIFDPSDEINPEADMTEAKKQEIKEKLLKNHERTTDYRKYYKPEDYGNHYKNNQEDEEEAKQEKEWNQMVEDLEARHEQAKVNQNRPPRIVAANKLGEIDSLAYENEILYYFVDDDVLVDEDGEEIDINYHVGNCFSKFGFDDPDNKEEVIFIQNFNMGKLFEIRKEHGDWDPDTFNPYE